MRVLVVHVGSPLVIRRPEQSQHWRRFDDAGFLVEGVVGDESLADVVIVFDLQVAEDDDEDDERDDADDEADDDADDSTECSRRRIHCHTAQCQHRLNNGTVC